MSSHRSINVYVLQNGKYVMKKKEEHELFVPTTRSEKNDPPESVKKQADRGEENRSDSQSKVNLVGNCDLTNSAVLSRNSGYVPKYFTSRKVSVNLDPYNLSPSPARVEQTVQHHTHNRSPTRPFSLLPIETISRHGGSEPDEAFYTPRDNERSDEPESELIRLKDKEIASLNKRLEELTKTNKELKQQLKTSKFWTAGGNQDQSSGDLTWYRQALVDRTHEVQALKQEHQHCLTLRAELTQKNMAFQRVHHQLCLELLKLKGQVLEYSDFLGFLCDSYNSSRKNNESLRGLQSQVTRINAQLVELQDSNFEQQQTRNIVQSLRSELKWQNLFLQAYRGGLEKKQGLQKILTSFLHKERFDNYLIRQLKDQVSINNEIVIDLSDMIHDLANQLQASSHQVGSCRCKDNESREILDRRISYLLLNAKLSQGESRMETIKRSIQTRKSEIELKTLQSVQLKGRVQEKEGDMQSGSTSQSIDEGKHRIRQLDCEINQLQEGILKLEAEAAAKKLEVEKLSAELREIGTRPPTGPQRSPEAPQSLEITYQNPIADDQPKRLIQVQ